MGVIMRNGIRYAGTPQGGSGGSSEAIDINYDNTLSQLESVNVQDAIDEINDKIEDTDTTYTFAEGTVNGAFSVTPKGGSEQSVQIHGVVKKVRNDIQDAINLLPSGTNTPVDEDYYISQYVGGGTTNTSYYRRPTKCIWDYVKDKIDTEGYTKNQGTITEIQIDGASISTEGIADITSIPADILNGKIKSRVTANTQSQGDNSEKLATTAYVDIAANNIILNAQKTQGRNLIPYPYAFDDYETNGVKVEINKRDGSIHVYGTPIYPSVMISLASNIQLIANKSYFLSGAPKTDQNISIVLFLPRHPIYDEGDGVKFSPEEDCSCSIKIDIETNEPIDYVFYPMLEINKYKREYEPTTESNVNLAKNLNDTKTLLGSTDISDIGDGSVTGAIDALDSNKVINFDPSNHSIALDWTGERIKAIVDGTDAGELVKIDEFTKPLVYKGKFEKIGDVKPDFNNTEINPGYYSIPGTNNIENHPNTGQAYGVFIQFGDEYKTQFLIMGAGNVTGELQIYARRYLLNNGWQNWRRFLSDKDLGTANISSIGDGTITGAISNLNTKVNELLNLPIAEDGEF